MDLMAVSNGLKNLSDQQLQQMAQMSPEVPPWLIVTEMQRRDTMRKEYQAQASKQPTNKTVAQEVAERFGQQQQGPPQPPQGPPQQGGGIASLAGQQGPPRMANGGIVDLLRTPPFLPTYDRGQLESSLPPAMSTSEMRDRYPVPTVGSVYQDMRGLYGDDPMAPVAKDAAAEYAKNRAAKPNPWEMLANFGFSLASGDSHSFGKNLGGAGLAALANQQSQKDRAEALAQKAMADRIAAARSQGERQSDIVRMATEAQRGQVAQRNTDVATIEDARRQRQQQEYNAPLRDAQIQDYKARAGMRDAIAEQRSRIEEEAKALATHPELVASAYDVKLTTEQANAIKAAPPEVRMSLIEGWQKRRAAAQAANPNEYSILMRAAQGDPDAKKAYDMMIRKTVAGRAQMMPGATGGGGVGGGVVVNGVWFPSQQAADAAMAEAKR